MNTIESLKELPGSNGKAHVVSFMGNETLFSYSTKIMTRLANGTYVRHWDGRTATTSKHIKLFSGLNYAEYAKLELV